MDKKLQLSTILTPLFLWVWTFTHTQTHYVGAPLFLPPNWATAHVQVQSNAGGMHAPWPSNTSSVRVPLESETPGLRRSWPPSVGAAHVPLQPSASGGPLSRPSNSSRVRTPLLSLWGGNPHRMQTACGGIPPHASGSGAFSRSNLGRMFEWQQPRGQRINAALRSNVHTVRHQRCEYRVQPPWIYVPYLPVPLAVAGSLIAEGLSLTRARAVPQLGGRGLPSLAGAQMEGMSAWLCQRFVRAPGWRVYPPAFPCGPLGVSHYAAGLLTGTPVMMAGQHWGAGLYPLGSQTDTGIHVEMPGEQPGLVHHPMILPTKTGIPAASLARQSRASRDLTGLPTGTEIHVPMSWQKPGISYYAEALPTGLWMHARLPWGPSSVAEHADGSTEGSEPELGDANFAEVPKDVRKAFLYYDYVPRETDPEPSWYKCDTWSTES